MRTSKKYRQDANFKLDLDFQIQNIENSNSCLLIHCGRTARQVRNSLRKNGFFVSIARIEKVCERFKDSQLYYTSLSDEDILSELNVTKNLL